METRLIDFFTLISTYPCLLYIIQACIIISRLFLPSSLERVKCALLLLSETQRGRVPIGKRRVENTELGSKINRHANGFFRRDLMLQLLLTCDERRAIAS